MKSSMLFKMILCIATLSASVIPQQKSTFKPDLSHSASISAWTLDGSGSWNILEGKLVLFKAGVPAGPIRRPAALAILKTKPFRRVTVEAEIRSTAPLDTVRRDLDIIVGYESPNRFYYIHLAGISDNVHNGIFLVNYSNRVRIDSGEGKAQLIDSTWHHIRIERDGLTGRIAVFVDRSRRPALEANDATICCGRVGFGSFDDTGEFRHILIKGIEK